MKTFCRVLFAATVLCTLNFFHPAVGQAPYQINYQAIVRDNTNQSINDQDVSVKFSVRQGSPTGTEVYWETHPAHTNSFGLINLKIGSIRTGLLDLINWAAGPYYLKVEVDTKDMGTTQLISVPFAFYAEKAGNGFSGVYNDLTGKPNLGIYLTSETDPVFGASVAKNITAGNVSNWNTAYGWGNHSLAGYLTTQISHADVLVDGDFTVNGLMRRTAAGVYSTVTDNSTNWNTAYSWGNHALSGYLTSQISHADVVVDGDFASNGLMSRTAAGVYGIVTDNSANWNTAYSWGNHALGTYLADSDFPANGIMRRTAAGVYSTVTDNSTNWNTAYSWGNHALGTYLADSDFPANGIMKRTAAGVYTTITDNTAEWNTPKWVRQADSLYYIEGNVGIGTKDPKSTLSVKGTTPTDSAIFEVKNNNGITVFAVYNEGVRITVDETAKASKGGFAVGGFSTTKGVTRDYLRMNGDSIRMYIDNSAAGKGAKGGFAVGGFDASKAGNTRYMSISALEGTNSGYNTFLGYKAGGTGTGGISNIAIGYFAGYSLNYNNATLGRNNIMIGDSAGLINNSGYQNVYIGKKAGAKAGAGYHNIYIGYKAGSEGHGQYNTFVGNEAGRYNAGGYGNVFMGDRAGQGVSTGDRNTIMGSQAGWKLADGNDNVMLGFTAGFNAANTHRNVLVGSNTGGTLVTGTDNTFIGYNAGNMTEGSNNIFIGKNAGQNISSATGRLIIDNSARSTVEDYFITGDIQAYKLRFNTSVSIWTNPDPTHSLTVNGKILATAFDVSSDARLKENIEPISDPLSKVMELTGVSFNWKDRATLGDERHIGFIAQDVDRVMPEVVNKGGAYYSMEYSPLTALLVEAVKVLKKENDILAEKVKKIESLEAQIEELKTLISAKGNK
jgi:hypothetical protein